MSWRRQLPVYSPLSIPALAAGLAAVVGGGDPARARVKAWIQERYDPRQSLLTDSGTSALVLAMQAASRRRPGQPVLLPTYSCYDLVTAALAARVDVRWYDLDPATLQPDWRALEAALTESPAAVVVVHHFGIPADIGRVRGLLDSRGRSALLIEDAAQAIGGRLDGRPLGALGDFGVLSFGRGKGVTGGGGGALLGNTREATLLLEQGAATLPKGGLGATSLLSTKAQWLLGRPSLYALPASLPFLELGATVFRPPHAPREMATTHAGVLSRTLPLQEAETGIRQQHASRLMKSAGTWGIPVTGSGARAGYLRLPLLLPPALARFRETPDARTLGVMPGYPTPLPSLPGSPLPKATAPGAAILAERLVTFPVHSLLRAADLDDLEDLLDRWRARIPPEFS